MVVRFSRLTILPEIDCSMKDMFESFQDKCHVA